jgi:hypothetical protein
MHAMKFLAVLVMCAGLPSAQAEGGLGIWTRLLETPWKEYGDDGAVQHVLFSLASPGVIRITVRTDAEVRAEAVVRLTGDRSARYCPLRKGVESCNADATFDDRSITLTFDDRNRLPDRIVLENPDTFVHFREIEGVKSDEESFASRAFDTSEAVRERARASMERHKRAIEEIRRRRAAKAAQSESPAR